jgi:hypothetical protein
MQMEMELEKLERMMELFKDNKEQLMLIGQLNHISETSITVELLVSTKADYNGDSVIVTYRKDVGMGKLPYDENDAIGQQKMKEFETKIEQERMKLETQIKTMGFQVEHGVWKILK